MEKSERFTLKMIEKSYMKVIMDFVEGYGWKTKYLPT